MSSNPPTVERLKSAMIIIIIIFMMALSPTATVGLAGSGL